MAISLFGMCQATQRYHTAGSDTIFVQIYMDLPPGAQGCQMMHQNPLNMPFEGWCANIAPERHKLRKTVKIGKKCQKTAVFLDIFEYSSIWGQYQRTKPQMARLVDPGASFDTPGTPGGGSIQKISRFQHLVLIYLSGGAPYNFFQIIQNKV